MENVRSLDYESLSSEQFARLDQVAMRFEAAWQRQEQPEIEAFLTADLSDLRSIVLQELLMLELEYRSRQGEHPGPEDYEKRFPHDRECIAAAFADHRHASADDAESIGTSSSSNDEPTQEGSPDSADDPPRKQQKRAAKLPKRLGRYEILRLIADGGFGRVLLAKDLELDRLVAIKIARRESFVSKKEVNRYLKEARMAARLSHPNIVSIHDVGVRDDLGCYIVMDFIDGGPLDVEEMASRLNMAEVVSLVAQTADAVHHAHTKGLVHRDLKPGNILLDSRGVPYVADFGLAVHESEQYDHEGEVSGTPPYMSPEQVRGLSHQLDGRTDIWSLGVLLYQLLSGRQPFLGTTRERVFDEILHRDPKPLRQINDRIPADLERICLRALVKQPAERYSTALDLADDLRSALAEWGESFPVPPAPPPVARRARPRTRRRSWKWPLVGACAACAVIAACSLAWLVRPRPEPIMTELPFPGAQCTHVALAGDNALLAAANDLGEVTLYRHNGELKMLEKLLHASPIRDVCFSRDTRLLGVLCAGDPVVYLYSTENGKRLATKARPVQPIRLLPSDRPDSLRFVDLSTTMLMVRDAPSGVVERRADRPTMQGLQVAQSQETLVLLGYDQASGDWIVRFAGTDGSRRQPLTGLGPIHSFAVAPDGGRIALGGYDPTFGVRLYGADNAPRELPSAGGADLWYHRVAFLHGGQMLVAVSRRRSPDATGSGAVIRGWRLAGDLTLVLEQTVDQEVTQAAFDRERNRICLVLDNAMRFYQVEDAR